MLYVFNPSEELIATIPSTDYLSPKHKEILNGDNNFRFTIKTPEHMPFLEEGNLVAFRDLDNYFQIFEIKTITDTHNQDFEKLVYCEHILYELLDDIVTDKRPSAGATAALSGMLENTRWSVGIVDEAALGSSSCTAYYESALSGVQKVAEAWAGELNWRCVISGGVITRYCDLLVKRGADTGKLFTYDKDMEEIQREVDISDVCTALYGRGKGTETDEGGFGRRLNFADVVWTVAGGDPCDKPAGQEWVGDTSALAVYGRKGRHRFDIYTNDNQTNAEVLLQETWEELQNRKIPRATYKLKVTLLEMLTGYSHEAVRLGDLVRAIDLAFSPELRLSARVVELERDLIDPEESWVTLGNFAPTIVTVNYNLVQRVSTLSNTPYNTNWLDGKISVLQNAIENTQSYVFQTADDGILILDAADYATATKAMKLGGGIFAIANQKDGQGGWNWRTFGDGSGFTADLITAGTIDAGLITVGPETTFAPGYDPTLIDPSAVATMGVDSDCLGLWHFDGSLNSHKGVPAIGDDNFDTGCFGQAVKVTTPINGDVSTGKESGMSSSSQYSSAFSPDNLVDGSIVFGNGTAFASASGAAFPQWHQIDLGDTFSINKVRWINNRRTQSLPQNYTIAISETGAFTGEQLVVVTQTGNTTFSTWVEHTFTPVKGRYVRMTVSTVVSGTYYELAEWQIYGTRIGVLKAPTTGLTASQGTISFRVKNLSTSVNGSVLIDLPKSDNTQGIKAGISSETGHEGEICISDAVTVSKNYSETTQADFNSGTLIDVVSTSVGNLELKNMGKALSFDGVDDYVDCGNGASLNFTNAVTLEAWIKGNAFNNYVDIVSKGVTFGGTQAYSLAVTNSGVLFFEINSSAVRHSVTFSIASYVGQLVHVAGVYDRSKMAIYVNGEEKASTSVSNLDIAVVSASVKISAPSRYFNGVIDDVRIWNTARTQTQIQDNMNKELVGNETGLVGCWKLNEGTGTVANDSTINNNDGTINGASWVVSPYKSLGTREKVVDLSGANPAGGTEIEWSKTTPINTTVKVETALSTDGGTAYAAYQEATSGNSIPGIASDTDLSNARLKIKETLITTDTSKTPQLNSLSLSIIEKQASTVYGPNKSTLTGWDSISLAWKPERLSLVINDSEVAYIENPGLPSVLGSYLFIGTDRNSANAINTLVDELRIDKVYREVATRTAWHKAGTPFYTSEDMKQWPGYMKAETDGVAIYDSEGKLRVKLGSWVRELIRRYGLKIIGGEIYATTIQSGEEGATSYIRLGSGFEPLEVVEDGKTALTIWSYGGGMIQIYDTDLNDMVGQLIAMNDAVGQGLRVQARNLSGSARDLHLDAKKLTLGATDSIAVSGNFSSHLLPIYHDFGLVGTSTRKWSGIYGVIVQSGDLAFEERSCPICGETFKDGDILCLLVKTIDAVHGTMTIPVHEKCKDKSVLLDVQVPESVTTYELNDRGEVESIQEMAFDEVNEEIITINPNYELDKVTGSFKRAMTQENIEIFGEEAVEAGIPCSREVALVTDTLNKKIPKWKTVQLQIGTPVNTEVI